MLQKFTHEKFTHVCNNRGNKRLTLEIKHDYIEKGSFMEFLKFAEYCLSFRNIHDENFSSVNKQHTAIILQGLNKEITYFEYVPKLMKGLRSNLFSYNFKNFL